MTQKENYLRMIKGEIPEFIPSWVEPYMMGFNEELLTPNSVQGDPVVTTLGVTYVGSPEFNGGAMPEPNNIIIDDITKWRDQLKIRDLTGWDWESYYKKATGHIDRENLCLGAGGGDYFLTLVSLMGFENSMLALYEEPEEVKALLEHISDFYIMVMKKQFHYIKPDIYTLMDDDAAYRAPFFSVDTYREFFKPFHKRHCDIALESGCVIDRHDCGKSEQFIDDWLEIGVKSWNPVQITNDCKAIKQKYVGRLSLAGCWDLQGELGSKYVDDKVLKDAMVEYTDTYAPGGTFIFSARISGDANDAEANVKRDVIKAFYNDYVRNWYKTHA